MKKNETLLKECHFYKGEDQNPFEKKDQNKSMLWTYERVWYIDVQNESASFADLLQEYFEAGLREFEMSDGVPITLKALLFNRYMKDSFDSNPNPFKEFYLKYYKESAE